MQRLLAIMAFALLLAVPAWTQHGGGGGHGGGGHAGGFGGGHGGGFGGGHAGGFSGPSARAYSGSPGYSRRYSQLPPTFGFNHPPTGAFTPPTSPLVRQPYASNGFGRGFGRNGFAGNRFRNNGGINFRIRSYPYWWGYGYGYPYWGWSYFDPWWWFWDSDSNDSNGNDDYYDNLAAAQQMNEQSLQEQQMLQQEQADGDQDAYNQNPNQGAYNQQPPANQYAYLRPPLDPERLQEYREQKQTAGGSFMRSTVLVFRDQHKEEVGNYAIVGQTLWNFAPSQTEKIPLSELDVPATIKANQDRGVTFSVPSSGEGQ
jgi:hypothetical protein